MKLHCANYESPIDTEGVYQDVYIEEKSYKLQAHEETNKPYFFQIEFEMYHIKNDKKVLLGEFQQSFLGTNDDLKKGKPTTNKKSIIRLLDFEIDPEIPEFIEGEEPETMVKNPAYIPESGVVNMVHYVYAYGSLPESYGVIDWGCATAEDAMLYFDGGTLDEPRLFISNPFAKEWLKNTVQMKGMPITQFEFVD